MDDIIETTAVETVPVIEPQEVNSRRKRLITIAAITAGAVVGIALIAKLTNSDTDVTDLLDAVES